MISKMIPFPTTVDLALTGRCNLRCKHCNASDAWELESELSFDEIIGVLDQIRKEKVFNLNLFGGEPFCYPEIHEILEALNSYPIRITILTNGTLIDKKAVESVKKMRFLAAVQVSVDGSNPSVHDWQRGEGSFDKAMNGVRLLMEEGLPVNLKAIINRHNIDDMENMIRMAMGLGLGGMDFGDAVECGRAAVYANELVFEGETHRKMMETMFRLKKKYPRFNLGGTLGQKVSMLCDFYANGRGKGARGTFSTCPAGFSMLSIRSDGKVVPCSAFWTLVCGDLGERSLKDIWENSQVLNEIRALADEALDKYKKECADCDYLTYCNGGCRAAAYYSAGGDLRGINMSTCLVFSDLYGFRVEKDTALSA